jgi:hypothetical protein
MFTESFYAIVLTYIDCAPCSNMGMWEIPNKFTATAKYIGITTIHEINLTRYIHNLKYVP